MESVCPITNKSINERGARINALISFLLVIIFIITKNPAILAFLAIDFSIRGFFDVKYSPVSLMSKWLVKVLNLKSKSINAGPKIFAAQIGMVFCLSAFLLQIAMLPSAAILVISILALFSFLETAFGLCVACKIYPILRPLV